MVAPLSRMRGIPAQPMGLKTLERFFSLVHRPKDDLFACWLWLGATSRKGHGRFKLDGKLVSPHRLSFAQFVGEIPDGLYVCHRCDVGGCVRPDHLFLGTCSDNMKDAAQKGRLPQQSEAWKDAHRVLRPEHVDTVRQLLDSRVPLDAIAKQFRVGHRTLDAFIAEHGIPCRRRTPAPSSQSPPNAPGAVGLPILEVA